MKNIPVDFERDPNPVFDSDLCTSCGICAESCPENVIQLTNDARRIKLMAGCTYCGTCEQICPQGAVSLEYEIQ